MNVGCRNWTINLLRIIIRCPNQNYLAFDNTCGGGAVVAVACGFLCDRWRWHTWPLNMLSFLFIFSAYSYCPYSLYYFFILMFVFVGIMVLRMISVVERKMVYIFFGCRKDLKISGFWKVSPPHFMYSLLNITNLIHCCRWSVLHCIVIHF